MVSATKIVIGQLKQWKLTNILKNWEIMVVVINMGCIKIAATIMTVDGLEGLYKLINCQKTRISIHYLLMVLLLLKPRLFLGFKIINIGMSLILMILFKNPAIILKV